MEIFRFLTGKFQGFELRQYQFEIVPDLNRNTKRNWNQKREKWKIFWLLTGTQETFKDS